MGHEHAAPIQAAVSSSGDDTHCLIAALQAPALHQHRLDIFIGEEDSVLTGAISLDDALQTIFRSSGLGPAGWVVGRGILMASGKIGTGMVILPNVFWNQVEACLDSMIIFRCTSYQA